MEGDKNSLRGKRRRHLNKKDKEALVCDAFSKSAEKLTLCCICFNEFQPSDVLVVVPCKYRHYFHRSCAQTCKLFNQKFKIKYCTTRSNKNFLFFMVILNQIDVQWLTGIIPNILLFLHLFRATEAFVVPPLSS